MDPKDEVAVITIRRAMTPFPETICCVWSTQLHSLEWKGAIIHGQCLDEIGTLSRKNKKGLLGFRELSRLDVNKHGSASSLRHRSKLRTKLRCTNGYKFP